MKYREVAEKLRKLGCEEIPRRSRGSHRKWHNPATGAIRPLPDWGAKDLKMGTLRQVIRGLGLDWDEFLKA